MKKRRYLISSNSGLKPGIRRIKMLFVFVLIISMMIFSHTGDAKKTKKAKKLYISTIKVEGLPKAMADRVREDLKLTIFEKYGDKYQILDDEAIKVMYKQASEILASGCTDESCMMQIADGINADELIFGSIRKKGSKLQLFLTNLERNQKTLALKPKSMVKLTFFESQFDHFVPEAGKKLMNKRYRINKKAKVVFNDLVNIKAIKIKKVKGFGIAVMKFKSNDETITMILDYLKDFVKRGDIEFKNENYPSARESYGIVLTKIKTKLTPKWQRKMKNLSWMWISVLVFPM
jgi:hypothetical protein